MARQPHRAHRFRIVSRCGSCGVKLLGACAYGGNYRGCDAITIYQPTHKPGCSAPRQYKRMRVTRINLVREAHRIFETTTQGELTL